MLVFVLLTLLGVTALLVTGRIVRIVNFITASNNRAKSDMLGDDEPVGLHHGNWLLWKCFKWTFLPVFGWANWYTPPVPILGRLIHRRFELIGAEYVREAEELGEQSGVFVTLDHRSSSDVFLPQLILYMSGFKRIAEELFAYVIGLKFFNRHWFFSFAISCRERVPVVPEKMRAEPEGLNEEELAEFTRRQHGIRTKISRAADRVVAEWMKQGRWVYIALEGTRSRVVTMIDVSKANYLLINKPGVFFLPVATEGTEKWWPVDARWKLWKLRPWTSVKMIVGKPILIDDLKLEAASWAAMYGISAKQAFVDIIMYRIAQLHQEHGDPWYMGVWAEPPEIRYGKKVQTEELEEVGVGGS